MDIVYRSSNIALKNKSTKGIKWIPKVPRQVRSLSYNIFSWQHVIQRLLKKIRLNHMQFKTLSICKSILVLWYLWIEWVSYGSYISWTLYYVHKKIQIYISIHAIYVSFLFQYCKHVYLLFMPTIYICIISVCAFVLMLTCNPTVYYIEYLRNKNHIILSLPVGDIVFIVTVSSVEGEKKNDSFV